jgi:hypothetical protein
MKISCGKVEAMQNAETINYSAANGFSYAGSISGLKETVRPFINQLAALGYSFTYRCDRSPLATIDFDSAGSPQGGNTENPTLVWEYYANRAEIDIMQADIPGTIAGQMNFNGITDEDRKLILREIQVLTEEDLIDFGDPNADALLALMIKGVRSFRVFAPVLRVSKLVSNTYAVQASQTNVGRIISAATLASQESVPTRLFTLPSNVSGKVGFAYGFYKNFPNIQQATAGRWQVSQEWDWGLWATAIYGNVL